MNILKAAFCRVYQGILYLASNFIGYREPRLIDGDDAIGKIPETLDKWNRFHPLIVTDSGIHSIGLDKRLTDVLGGAKVSYELYSDVLPNPTFSMVEDALTLYKKGNCDCIIALGGGSAMDCAKAVGARVANPNRTLASFKGVLKVRKKMPLFMAIPTTAGTGSEATLAAVIVNEKTHDKFAIQDPKIIPHFAVLDDSLLSGLPKKVISTTGMDALTHAIESHIGREPTKKTRAYALEASKLIKDNLFAFYSDPSAKGPRAAMQKAAYLAGVSFTRSYVGYVHALAHSLGGFYNVPHGLANAVILPYVLEAYGKSAHKRLSEIADFIGVSKEGQGKAEKAASLIAWIRDMNSSMGIPDKVEGVRLEDVKALVRHAEKEGNPLYPVPKEFNERELEAVLLAACK